MFLNKNKSIACLKALLFIAITTSLQLQAHIKTITNEDEFVCLIDQKHPTIVMGSMDACPHCKTITPIFENHAKKHPSISFIKANGPKTNMHGVTKRESQGKGDFKIIGYPAFVFIKDKKIVNVVVGGTPELLEKAIKDFANDIDSSFKKRKRDEQNIDQQSNKKSKK